jgi:hypothetical protein
MAQRRLQPRGDQPVLDRVDPVRGFRVPVTHLVAETVCMGNNGECHDAALPINEGLHHAMVRPAWKEDYPWHHHDRVDTGREPRGMVTGLRAQLYAGPNYPSLMYRVMG